MSDPYARSRDRTPAFRIVLYGMWVYLTCLGGATVYTVLWFVGVVDGPAATTIGIVWIVITSLGAAFLMVVVPVVHRSRLSLY